MITNTVISPLQCIQYVSTGTYGPTRPYYRHHKNSHGYTTMQNTHLSKNHEKITSKRAENVKKQLRSIFQALNALYSPKQ